MREGIAELARGRLRDSSYTALRGVGCHDRGDVLELEGELPSHYLRQLAQTLVLGVEGVTAVTNRIRVAAPRPIRAPEPRGDVTVRTMSRRVEVMNAQGFHLRAAERFAGLAQQFRSEVRVSCGARWADGKSILDLATLAAACGQGLDIEATGPDAEEALAALAGLVAVRFHEEG